MSIAEFERFAADLKSNEVLRGEAEKASADNPQAVQMDRLIALAASRGYAFTADDVKQFATARQISDVELGGIVGGNLSTTSASRGIDQGKLEVGKAAAKSYGDSFSKRSQ
jgi:predicted ribosomally synthesized peptide with nif11-like leader